MSRRDAGAASALRWISRDDATSMWGDGAVDIDRSTGERRYRVIPSSPLAMLGGLERYLGRTFLTQGQSTRSYADFAWGVESVAARLAGAGIVPGSRVGIHAYNSPEFVLATWATWRLGAVPVMGNRWWNAGTIAHAHTITTPDLVLTDLDDYPVTGVPVLRLRDISDAWTDRDVHAPAISEPGPEAIAVVVFTSGSTGAPKAVALSNRSLATNQVNILSRSGHLPGRRAGDHQTVTLVSTPLFHIAGVSSMITQPVTGGKVVLVEGRFDPVRVVEAIQAERVESWGGVPTMARRVLELPDLERYDLSSLRSFPIGGAPLPPNLLARLRERFPQFEQRGFANTWGMTESGGFVTMANSRDLAERPGTVGRPYPVAEVRVEALTPGAVGEVVVRSPTLMTGYLGDDEEGNGPIDDNGWLHTGDLGHLDDDGFLYLDGRSKDVIIRGGENVASRRVEAALLEYPGVADAAVIGVPHVDLGEEIAAVLVVSPQEEIDLSKLQGFLRQRLASFEVPSKWFTQQDPLPTLPGEKIDKRGLAAARASGPWLTVGMSNER